MFTCLVDCDVEMSSDIGFGKENCCFVLVFDILQCYRNGGGSLVLIPNLNIGTTFFGGGSRSTGHFNSDKYIICQQLFELHLIVEFKSEMNLKIQQKSLITLDQMCPIHFDDVHTF